MILRKVGPPSTVYLSFGDAQCCSLSGLGEVAKFTQEATETERYEKRRGAVYRGITDLRIA